MQQILQQAQQDPQALMSHLKNPDFSRKSAVSYSSCFCNGKLILLLRFPVQKLVSAGVLKMGSR